MTEIQVEGALCAWECMLEWRGGDKAPAGFNEIWEGVGSSAMRHVAMQAGAIAELAYSHMKARGIEFHSCYDWEFVPGVLWRLDWPSLVNANQYGGPSYRPNVSAILRDMMAAAPDDYDPCPALTSWLGKARWQAHELYAYIDLVSDHEDRFRALFDAGEDPRAAVLEVGEKYNLTRADSW